MSSSSRSAAAVRSSGDAGRWTVMPLSAAARYGLHRVLDGPGVFPQPAQRLDNDPRISDAEMLVRVERLNLDSASFRQLREAAGGDPSRIAGEVERIVAERGKMHNPVTGSGGMLIGTVRRGRQPRPGDARRAARAADRQPDLADADAAAARPGAGRRHAPRPDRRRGLGRTLRVEPVRRASRGHRRADRAGGAGRGRRAVDGRRRSSSRAIPCCWSAAAGRRVC